MATILQSNGSSTISIVAELNDVIVQADGEAAAPNCVSTTTFVLADSSSAGTAANNPPAGATFDAGGDRKSHRDGSAEQFRAHGAEQR